MLITAVLTTVASPAFAQRQQQGQACPPRQAQGTPEDERACRTDATRLCRQVLLACGDEMAMLACFQQNRARLSRSCNAVLQKYGQ